MSEKLKATYLCMAWGETDFPAAAIVTDMDTVRAFLVEQWLGSADETDDCGVNLLDWAVQDMQEQWALEGDAWKWEFTFEIGGVSVQRVGDFSTQQPARELESASQPGGEPVAWSYECRQPCTDPVRWAEFMSRKKPKEDNPNIRNVSPLYAIPKTIQPGGGKVVDRIISWLRANCNAERSAEAKQAFAEAHNAALVIRREFGAAPSAGNGGAEER